MTTVISGGNSNDGGMLEMEIMAQLTWPDLMERHHTDDSNHESEQLFISTAACSAVTDDVISPLPKNRATNPVLSRSEGHPFASIPWLLLLRDVAKSRACHCQSSKARSNTCLSESLFRKDSSNLSGNWMGGGELRNFTSRMQPPKPCFKICSRKLQCSVKTIKTN